MTELSLVLMSVIWGVNFSVVKYGTQVMEPLAYTALRITRVCGVHRRARAWERVRRSQTS